MQKTRIGVQWASITMIENSKIISSSKELLGALPNKLFICLKCSACTTSSNYINKEIIICRLLSSCLRWPLIWVQCAAQLIAKAHIRRETRIRIFSLTIDALKIRAPSMCNCRPYVLASSPILSVYSAEIHLPPHLHPHSLLQILKLKGRTNRCPQIKTTLMDNIGLICYVLLLNRAD